MAISHHPDGATMLSYAAGTLAEGLAAVVAAHICVCPQCARELKGAEDVGGALIETLDPAPLSHATPVLAASGRATRGQQSRRTTPVGCSLSAGEMPAPLRHFTTSRIDDIPWRRLGMGVWHVPLALSAAGEGDLRLLRVAPGRAMPEHGHGGAELTLVLRGAYHDHTGDYRAGDLADLDDTIEHRPISCPYDGCICVIASESRARFKGVFGRLMQPLTGL